MRPGLSPARLNVSGGAFEQLLGFAFEFETRVLIGLGARQRGDALHEIENRFRRPPLLRQHHLDDLAGLTFREAAPAKKCFAVVILTSDDPLACRLDAGDEGRRRGIGKAGQRGRCLKRKPLGGKLRVPDGDFLEILGAPEIAIGADGPEIERGDAERLRSTSEFQA